MAVSDAKPVVKRTPEMRDFWRIHRNKVAIISVLVQLLVALSVIAIMIILQVRLDVFLIATIVIFNVLYIWNEYPYASVMLKDVSDYTLSMGASFFKGNYTVDYGGIVASSLMIIVPELIFYGLFQKNIVEGMTAGAVKG